MTVQVNAHAFKVREVEAIDSDDEVPGLTLGDLRALVEQADKNKLDDGAKVYAGRCRESSSQPGRLFIGTLLVQQVDR